MSSPCDVIVEEKIGKKSRFRGLEVNPSEWADVEVVCSQLKRNPALCNVIKSRFSSGKDDPQNLIEDLPAKVSEEIKTANSLKIIG